MAASILFTPEYIPDIDKIRGFLFYLSVLNLDSGYEAITSRADIDAADDGKGTCQYRQPVG
jgi:hypothetical protein